MQLLCRLLATVLFCFAFSSDSLQAAEPVGKVSAAKTAVYSAGSGGRKTLGRNDPVFFMDRLSTNATGIGEFTFDDGTKLALGPSASLTVDRFVQKGQSSFQKFGVAATKGTFRWISGRSPSSAYQIRTPTGTMGIRGTAFDVTTRNGVTHVVLLNGSARFCIRSKCEVLNRSGDYISTNGRSMSPKAKVTSVFSSRKEAARIFPFLANPGMLSPGFRVAGSNLLSKLASTEKGRTGKPGSQEGTNTASTGTGSDSSDTGTGSSSGSSGSSGDSGSSGGGGGGNFGGGRTCQTNCGAGGGNGGPGNGTGNQGNGLGPPGNRP